MTSAAMRSSISLPRRWETSRTRSFSRRPLGPSVPLSWPPWPGSMTTRLILRPRARMREFCPELVRRAALPISTGAAGAVASGEVTEGLAAGGLAADVVGAGSVGAGSVGAGGLAGSVGADGAAPDGQAADGEASFWVDAGGVGLGVAGTSEIGGLAVDGKGWMAIGGAEASGGSGAEAGGCASVWTNGLVGAGVGVDVGTEPDAWRNSTIRRLGLARVEEVGSTLSPRSSTTRVTALAVSATRMRRSSLSLTVSEYKRGPLTRGRELRMS